MHVPLLPRFYMPHSITFFRTLFQHHLFRKAFSDYTTQKGTSHPLLSHYLLFYFFKALSIIIIYIIHFIKKKDTVNVLQRNRVNKIELYIYIRNRANVILVIELIVEVKSSPIQLFTAEKKNKPKVVM